MNTIILTNTLGILLLATQVAPPTNDPQVPSGLRRSAAQEPILFVMALADASVPAGFEVRKSDLLPRGRPVLQSTGQPTVGLHEIVAIFNTHHTDYRAAIMDGVVVIRPVGRTAAYLEATIDIVQIAVTGVMEAARRIFGPLDPSLVHPGGRLGSSINTDTTDTGDNAVISIHGAGRVIDLLNDVVRQSPRAWLVEITDDLSDPEVSRFGFMHNAGTSTWLGVRRAKR